MIRKAIAISFVVGTMSWFFGPAIGGGQAEAEAPAHGEKKAEAGHGEKKANAGHGDKKTNAGHGEKVAEAGHGDKADTGKKSEGGHGGGTTTDQGHNEKGEKHAAAQHEVKGHG